MRPIEIEETANLSLAFLHRDESCLTGRSSSTIVYRLITN